MAKSKQGQDAAPKRRIPSRPLALRMSNQYKRTRKHGRRFSLTVKQWLDCLVYWRGRCAYCGVKAKLEMDHWIPLSHPACPGTIPTNILPACHGCNSRKLNLEPLVWLTWWFPTKHAAILRRIKTYFESLT